MTELHVCTDTAIQGQHLIAGQWQGVAGATFHSYQPAHDRALPWTFPEAAEAELAAVTAAAGQAFYPYSQTPRAQRAAFLRQIASEIEQLGTALEQAVMAETALPLARVQGERGRTCQQLRMFAALLEAPEASVYSPAQPERQPLPAPELRLGTVPLGPVVVFAASNFPLAFSVAGGDSAAALAAGCPVIVKAHNAHPLTSYLVATAIEKARQALQLPAGTFQLVFAQQHRFSEALICHPAVKAVAFTGSVPLGLHFQRLIQSRAEPIPFYGELGSQNPLLLLPDYARQDAESFGRQLLTSVLQGNGQFCTRPGLVFVPAAQLERVASTVAEGIRAAGVAVLLSPKIAAGYRAGCAQLAALSGIDEVAVAADGNVATAESGSRVLPRLFVTQAARFAQLPELQQEIFGPATVLISYQQLSEVAALIPTLHGQLSATLYATDADMQVLQSAQAGEPDLLWQLSQKAGRLIRNQMPTGVEVCSAMFHGGPFPASTDLRFTAVGSSAIARFVRPLCRQNLG